MRNLDSKKNRFNYQNISNIGSKGILGSKGLKYTHTHTHTQTIESRRLITNTSSPTMWLFLFSFDLLIILCLKGYDSVVHELCFIDPRGENCITKAAFTQKDTPLINKKKCIKTKKKVRIRSIKRGRWV